MEDPVHNKAYGAKLFFWYLRVFFAMGLCALATGTIWYQFINKHHPLQITPHGGVNRPFDSFAVIWGIATIAILAPILFFFGSSLRRAIRRDEVELNRGVRQWLSYIFLLLVVTVMLSDLVTAVIYLLNGDYSVRFFLKVIVIFAIAGWLFAYLWQDITSKDALAGSRLPRTMGLVSALVMLLSIGAGFTLIDTPMLARAKAFDNRRVSGIQELQFGVQNHHRRFGKLPESLEALRDADGMVRKHALADPQSGVPYEYRVIDDLNYEICAVFTTDNRDTEESEYGYYDVRGPYGTRYLHGAERTCFTQNVRESDEQGERY